MDRGAWKQPVLLEIYGRPGLISVSDTLEAAAMLLQAWPPKRTESHMIAARTCRDVLTGRAIPGLARANFIEAALDAGYHIQPETFLPRHSAMLPTRDFTPNDVLTSRWAMPAPVQTAEKAEMRELLGKLGEITGLILIEAAKNAAGFFNMGSRRRISQPTH